MKTSFKVIILIIVTIILLSVNSLFFDNLKYVLLADLLIFYASLIVILFIFKSAENKIRKISLDVEELAAGNLSKRIAESKDEMNQLRNVLNELAARIETNIAIDVTKNKQIDQAKSDFVALASHQLRTPLSIIKWYVDYVNAGDAGVINDEQKKYLSEVYRANERLIELVNNLLDVSRIDLGTFSIDPEPSDLIEIALSVLGKIDGELEKKKLKIEKIFDDIPNINLDKRLMKIVLENLLVNSIKYTFEEGKIRFEIKKADYNIMIKITDTGCGIPRSEQPKIFTKLFRAENVKRFESIGTGLGLYIVKAVIEKSGGKIWFESPSLELFLEEEKIGRTIAHKAIGTTFFISIPLSGMISKDGTKQLVS
jgi:signal transduction histidine kinase